MSGHSGGLFQDALAKELRGNDLVDILHGGQHALSQIPQMRHATLEPGDFKKDKHQNKPPCVVDFASRFSKATLTKKTRMTQPLKKKNKINKHNIAKRMPIKKGLKKGLGPACGLVQYLSDMAPGGVLVP